MSLSVRRLVRDTRKEFHLNLIAGAEGLDNRVDWVHIIEDYEVAGFLRGHELTLTTGIGNVRTPEAMYSFVQELHQNHVSGIVFNIGPYISEIPMAIRRYCDENQVPLFTLPWKTHLVDVMRHFCQMLLESEMKQKSLTSLVKDYLFHPDERKKLYEDLARNGFTQNMNYCVIDAGICDVAGNLLEQDKELELLHDYIDWEVSRRTQYYVMFKNEKKYAVVIGGVKTEEVRETAQALVLKSFHNGNQVHLAVSNNGNNLLALPQNYQLAERIFHLGMHLGSPLLFYDDLDFYKVLLSVSDRNVMQDYLDTALLPIREYDEGNGSNYLEFVRSYVKFGGNVQQMATEMYVHRNTIHYKMNKVKEISGINLTDMEDLLRVEICLKIANLL